MKNFKEQYYAMKNRILETKFYLQLSNLLI